MHAFSRRTILAAAAAALTLSFQATAARAEALDDIVKAGVIRIAVPQDFPPLRQRRHRPQAAGL